VQYLVENLEALQTELSADEIRELDKLYQLVKGDRYDQYSMASTLQ
jgi:diketogulonate reductase-like aldo/keto reductase